MIFPFSRVCAPAFPHLTAPVRTGSAQPVSRQKKFVLPFAKHTAGFPTDCGNGGQVSPGGGENGRVDREPKSDAKALRTVAHKALRTGCEKRNKKCCERACAIGPRRKTFTIDFSKTP